MTFDEEISRATYSNVVGYCNEHGLTLEDFLNRALEALGETDVRNGKLKKDY